MTQEGIESLEKQRTVDNVSHKSINGNDSDKRKMMHWRKSGHKKWRRCNPVGPESKSSRGGVQRFFHDTSENIYQKKKEPTQKIGKNLDWEEKVLCGGRIHRETGTAMYPGERHFEAGHPRQKSLGKQPWHRIDQHMEMNLYIGACMARGKSQ